MLLRLIFCLRTFPIIVIVTCVSLLCSEDLPLLRDLLRMLGGDLYRDHPGSAAHAQQLQAHLPGPGGPPR